MSTTPVVGQDVDSWCTKCKMMLAHTIETVVGSKITRVHCNTCKGQHAYRAKAPGTSSTRTRSSKAAAPRPPDYASLLRGRDASAAKPYAPTERFAEGDFIRHATFGPGVVTARKDVNKIEVIFEDGPKVLIHRRG
ncbi:MAG: hypothetical protein SF182_03570 [Deltaproteobacteria bacterium]|nr:hypothetical protein [Deltaproteobacteria bacterium]